MLVQIYEITTPAEAIALARIGVDHIGVLVGNGAFPRELPIETAGRILAAIPPPSRGSALCLSADLNVIEQIAFLIRPSILHLGASTTLLNPEHVARLKKKFFPLTVARSVPVSNQQSISIAKSYDGIADLLLLDSYTPGDRQIGALGVTHDWALDRAIVEHVNTPELSPAALVQIMFVMRLKPYTPRVWIQKRKQISLTAATQKILIKCKGLSRWRNHAHECTATRVSSFRLNQMGKLCDDLET